MTVALGRATLEMMSSYVSGANTSGVEVTHVNSRGFWILVDNTEHYLGFDQFPWFADATIRQISSVQLPAPHHLHWPELDFDLTLDMVNHPENYPLKYR